MSNEAQRRRDSSLPESLRAPGALSNVANDSTQSIASTHSDVLMIGTIIKSGVGSYDALVRLDNHYALPCYYLNKCLGFKAGFGTNEAFILPVDTPVLVYPLDRNEGIILGALPVSVATDMLEGANLTSLIAREGGVSTATDAAYKSITINANNIRPEDVVQGDYVLINEQQVTFAILKLMAFLKATDRAKLECFVLDDLVRLTSGQFQHITPAWVRNIVNDGGYNTDEVAGSHHQCEMTGHKDYSTPYVTTDVYDAASNENTGLKLVKPDLLPRNRYQSFTGHLGGIFSLFIGNPDPNINESTYATPQKDQGLFHTHIDGSGRLLVRSAGGIHLQRNDRIAIPKKIKEPWDPAGLKQELEDPTETKYPFMWDLNHPYGKHLQLRDALTWYTKNSYQRFIERHADWYLPEESELSVPIDKYDETDKVLGEDSFKDNDNKRSNISLEEDGSIILRDAWGSEIIMRGGNITLSCPGNIEIRPGKSIVALGGHDVIIKGKESVDVSATNKDVRIKANTNLHVYSENGILLESNSTTENQNYSSTGESVKSNGITLKAKQSRVFIWANVIHLGFIKSLFMEAFKSAGGIIYMLCNRLNAIASNSMTLHTKKAGLSINKNDSYLYGNSSFVFGGTNSGVFKGAKFLAPIMEAPIDTNPYKDLQGQLETAYINMWDDGTKDDIIGATYNISNRSNIAFTFRDDKQYGTNKGTEVIDNAKFYIYESTWSTLKASNYAFITGNTTKWEEIPVNDTYPWPGKANYDKDVLVTLNTEVNVENNITKKYSDMSNKANSLKTTTLKDLVVMDV